MGPGVFLGGLICICLPSGVFSSSHNFCLVAVTVLCIDQLFLHCRLRLMSGGLILPCFKNPYYHFATLYGFSGVCE